MMIRTLLTICLLAVPVLSSGSDLQTQQNPLYPYQSSIYLQDDFICGATTSGSIGCLGWATSAGTVTLQGGAANRPGVYRLDTSSTINTLARISFTASTLNPININHSEIFICRLNSNDANTTVRIGDSDGFGTNPPTNGIYFEKLAADTNWFVVTRSGGAETRTDTGVAVGTDFTEFKMKVTSTSIEFILNQTTVATHVTNIPTTSGGLAGFFITNTAAASKTIDIDYFQVVFTGLTR